MAMKEVTYDTLDKIEMNKSFRWYCLFKSMDGTYCGTTYSRYDSLWEHIGKHCYGSKGWRCGICGDKRFAARASINKHIKRHRKLNYKCKNCGVVHVNYQQAFRCCNKTGGGQRVKQTNPGV